jgi:hypothetical protein
VLTTELQLEAAKSWLIPPDKRTVTFEEGSTKALVNGSTIILPQAPLKQGDILYLPLRFVFEALGYQVGWQSPEGSIKVTDIQSEVLFYPGLDGRILLGGQELTGTDPLISKNGLTYVPVSSLKLLNLKEEAGNGRITIEK